MVLPCMCLTCEHYSVFLLSLKYKYSLEFNFIMMVVTNADVQFLMSCHELETTKWFLCLYMLKDLLAVSCFHLHSVLSL